MQVFFQMEAVDVDQAVNPLEHLLALAVAFSKTLSISEIIEVIRGVRGVHSCIGMLFLQNIDDTDLLNRLNGPLLVAWPELASPESPAIAEALRAREILVLTSRKERRQRYAQLIKSPFRKSVCSGALILLPLIDAGEPIGVLCFGFPEDRSFHADELTFMRAVAELCGQALARTKLHEEVCHRRQVEERLKELEERKDVFISIASHELKTPVTSIKILVQMLRKRLERQGIYEFSDYLVKMDAQIDMLTRLITDLLDISKMQTGKLDYVDQPFDLCMLITEIVEHLRAHNTSAAITVAGLPSLRMIGDRARLRQVFDNLISNAIKYSPEEAVRVELEIYLQGSHEQTSEHVVICVRDYGPGIPPEHQRRIFERFYRVQNEKSGKIQGLGIGLYIAQEIVQRHRGEIRVESEEGKGSTFYVVLPL